MGHNLQGPSTSAVFAEQLTLPMVLASRGLPALDAAMRLWAAEDPVVAEAVASADELRMRVIAALLQSAGVEPQQARSRATAMMWAFRGAGDADGAERTTVFQELLRLVMTLKA